MTKTLLNWWARGIFALGAISIAVLFVPSQARSAAPQRSKTFGQDWVRNHSLTTMALTLRDKQFDVDQYMAANLNVALIWKTQPLSIQSSAKANLPWMQRLAALNGADEAFQQRVRALTASASGHIGWLINDEPTDEQMQVTGQAIEWLKANYPDQLAMSNLGGAEDYAAHAEKFMNVCRPDVMMFDAYPYGPEGVETPRDLPLFLQRLATIREVAIGADVPYWAFVQAYDNYDKPYISESDMRMQVFAALTHGYTGLGYFLWEVSEPPGISMLDDRGKITNVYRYVAAANAEAIRLGAALTQLRNVAIGYVPGSNSLAKELPRWKAGDTPHIRAIRARNLGKVNDGKAGDVLIGAFTSATDQPAEYFMVTNMLRAHKVSPADSRQQVRIDFDFGDSGIVGLQRLSRLTGKVEEVALIHDDGSKFHLDLELDGGTGDLFKFDTGSPFALASPPEKSAGVDPASMKDWDIVVGADATESEQFAAEEFQSFFEQASGIRLPITSATSAENHHVYIGASPAMRQSNVGFSVDGFGDEDLKIVVRDENIAVAGGAPRGTLYGVYTFFEDYLGVRFLTADHTYVPKLTSGRQIGPLDRFYHPLLDYRWIAYEINYDRPDFCARLRLNGARGVPAIAVGRKDGHGAGPYGGRTQMRAIGHSFNHQIPPQVYGKDHPEYYCLRNGKRWASLEPGEDGIDFKAGEFPYGMQPCLTHPDVLRIVTKSALDELRANPDLLNVSVAGNDGGAFCQCADCTAINEREGAVSGSVLTFVNKVADEIAREFPDRLVGTLAYSDTQAPPATVRPRDNVQIIFCSIGTCFVHTFDDETCPTNVANMAQFRQWATMTKHLYAWNYFMNDEHRGYQLPMPNLRQIGPNIRFQVSQGVKGFFMQCTSSEHGNEFEDLRNYLLARLMWDPTLDDRELMNEWIDLHYGPAAEPIRQWIDRLHDRSLASGKHCRCMGGTYAEYGLDDSDVQFGLDAVDRAMKLAGDNQAGRERVSKASIWAYRAALEPVWYVKPGETVDPAMADRIRPLARRFFELCKKHGVTRTREVSPHLIEDHEHQIESLLGPLDAL